MTTPSAIGLRHLHLIDSSRSDPSTGRRELMVSVFYPAEVASSSENAKLIDLLEPAAAEVFVFLSQNANLSESERDHLSSLELRAKRDLAPLFRGTPRAVLIYYPGGQSHRLSNATLCEGLAADGFIVFCLDAPRDAPLVVYPDGRQAYGPLPAEEDYIWPRIADIHFLIDQLAEFNTTGFLSGQLDLSRIGAFGHSRGGYLATIAAVEDPRIRAVANMDGFLWGFWGQHSTGLEGHSTAFQERARSFSTPVLRLRGDQGSSLKAQQGFVEESADCAGDFISVNLHGWSHGDFATTPWLCGSLERIAQNACALSPPANRCALLRQLLTDFFQPVLVQEISPCPSFGKPREGMDIFFRQGPLPHDSVMPENKTICPAPLSRIR